MKTYRTETKSFPVEYTDSVACDVCGKVCDEDNILDIPLPSGYDSIFGDNQYFQERDPEINICHECFNSAFKKPIDKVIADFVKKDNELFDNFRR